MLLNEVGSREASLDSELVLEADLNLSKVVFEEVPAVLSPSLVMTGIRDLISLLSGLGAGGISVDS